MKLRFLFLLLFLASTGGAILKAGGLSAFETTGEPPRVNFSEIPYGFSPMREKPTPEAWKAFDTGSGRSRLICIVAYQERAILNFAEALIPEFPHTLSGPIHQRIAADMASRNAELVGEPEELRIAGKAALGYAFTSSASGGGRSVPTWSQALYVIHDGYGINVNCVGARERKARIRSAFDAFVGGIDLQERES